MQTILYVLKSLISLLIAFIAFAVIAIVISALNKQNLDAYLMGGAWLGIVLLFFLLRKKHKSPLVFHGFLYFSFFSLVFIVFSSSLIAPVQWQLAGQQGCDKEPDATLGYRYPADSFKREVWVLNQHDSIDAMYTFDHYGRRKMPENDTASEAILFFGCSHTFGDMVSDTQTLPYYYYLKHPTANVYNYALDGWGPQQALIQLQQWDIPAQVCGKVTNVYYVYIPDHLRRITFSKQHCKNWTEFFPYFIKSGDSLKIAGTIGEHFKKPISFWDHMSALKILDPIPYPLWPSVKDENLCADILLAMQKTSKARFPDARFKVIMYPWHKSPGMLQAFNQRGISVLDLSTLFIPMGEYAIPHNGHPTPLAYQTVARAIKD